MSTKFVILVIVEDLRAGVNVSMCNVGACFVSSGEMAYPGLFWGCVSLSHSIPYLFSHVLGQLRRVWVYTRMRELGLQCSGDIWGWTAENGFLWITMEFDIIQALNYSRPSFCFQSQGRHCSSICIYYVTFPLIFTTQLFLCPPFFSLMIVIHLWSCSPSFPPSLLSSLSLSLSVTQICNYVIINVIHNK